MRKNQLLYSALPIALLGNIATQAMAGENCLIDNPNLNNCNGAIQVTKEFIVNGSGPIVVDGVKLDGVKNEYSSEYYNSSYSTAYQANSQMIESQYENGQAIVVNNYAPPAYAPPAPKTTGCKLVQQVPCQGQWVVVGDNFAPPAQAYAPPVQAYLPPPNYSIQPLPQPIYNIPTSFFTGGMNYGVGYPTMTGYNSGGGMYMAGGTRFSGVVNRSTTPLIPPSGKPKQPPPPPPTGCGGGC